MLTLRFPHSLKKFNKPRLILLVVAVAIATYLAISSGVFNLPANNDQTNLYPKLCDTPEHRC